MTEARQENTQMGRKGALPLQIGVGDLCDEFYPMKVAKKLPVWKACNAGPNHPLN